MKKLLLFAATALCVLFNASAQDIDLEKWTYTDVAGLLPNAISETGTGSIFGSGVNFLIANGGIAIFRATGAANEGYSGGVSDPSYSPSTSGIYQISYDIVGVSFAKTGSGKGQFGWGLRSLASGTDECKALFQYNNGNFEFVAIDQSGTHTSTTIFNGISLLNTKVRMTYDLDQRGNPGSFRIYYTIGTADEIELFSGQLALHSDFQLDEFRMEVYTTANGNSWVSGDNSVVDNLLLQKRAAVSLLTFIGRDISFSTGGDHGVIAGDTYEPGDVLQIVTSNKNENIISENNVTTSLSADPTAFNITPSSTNFSSVGVGEIYTATYQVEVLDSVPDGEQTFTVINQIGAGADAIVFKDEL